MECFRPELEHETPGQSMILPRRSGISLTAKQKESSMTVSVQQARKVCNSMELSLVVDSTSKEIKNFDVKQLKSKVARARALRDKWRGQAEKLVRVAKKESQAKLDSDNARTELKSQLFSETLDRLSNRLETLEAKESTQTITAAKKKTPTVKAQHRARRADVRTVLADAKDQMNVAASLKQVPVTQSTQSASKTTEPSPATAKKATSKKVVRPATKTTEATKAISKPATNVGTTPKLPAKKKKSPISVATKSSVRVQAAAKSSAMVRGGAKPIHAHASATGKRNQARRDSKK
jgi:hypothetical protein